MQDMYPTIPALGSLPYDLNEQHERLLSVFGEGEAKELSEQSREVFKIEVDRLTTVLQMAQSMVERINSGKPTPSDSPDAVRNLIKVLSTGIDGLYAIVGNGTVLDYARNTFSDVGEGAKEAYSKVKEEVKETVDEAVDKVAGLSPFLIIILVLVLGIVIFAGRIGRT